MTETITAPEEHSRLVGGSTAGRRLACPGSYQQEQKVPPSVRRKSSSYADEGTALHEAMAYMLNNDILYASDVVGMEFGGKEDERSAYVITFEQARDALQPALDYFDAVIERMEGEPGAGDVQWLVETRVEVPGIPDAFGTMDVLIWSNVRTVGLDWKFGAGVRVLAIYPDDELGDLINPQGLFYLRGCMHTHPEAFATLDPKDETHPVEFHIVQPLARVEEGEDPNSMTDITIRELEQFRSELVRAIAEAKGKDPRLARGDHCRFAPCKSVCPLWNNAVIDMSKLKAGMEKRQAAPLGDVWDYGEAIAAALDLAAIVEPWLKEVQKQAHDFMDSGMHVPGWKLVDKRAYRKFKDEAAALDALRAAYPKAQDKHFFVTEMRSVADVEKELKAAKLLKGKLPNELGGIEIVHALSSGTTIAPEDDGRAARIPPGEVVKNFAEKMKLLLPPEPRPE